MKLLKKACQFEIERAGLRCTAAERVPQKQHVGYLWRWSFNSSVPALGDDFIDAYLGYQLLRGCSTKCCVGEQLICRLAW